MFVRPMKETDLDAVADIENACFSDPWSRKSFEDSLKEQAAHLLVIEAENAAKDSEFGFRTAPVIGYCCLYQTLDEGEIVNVAVGPKFRQKGYGAAMVRALMHLGLSLGVERFFLEVRAGNSAGKRLYESLGFEICGMRKGFYSNPREDAVLMMWQREDVCQ